VTEHKKAATRTFFPAHTNAAAVRFATAEELGKPVQDTPEVKAAKASFKAQYDAAAAAAEAAPDVSIITSGSKSGFLQSAYLPPAAGITYSAPMITYSAPVITLDAAGQVQDTAEVKAAKASFKAQYNAAAAAAEAAPDVNIITGPAPVVAPVQVYKAPATRVRYSGPLASLDSKGIVQETAEVKAAKAKFQATYNAAAAAAAPDVGIISGQIYKAPASIVRYYGPLATLDAEGNVEETAEVKAAKAKFHAVYNAAAVKAASVTSYSGPGVTLDAAGRVQDTAEVKAAKASFKVAYDASAAAAAAAPDVNIITGSDRLITSTGFTYSAPAAHAAYIAPAAQIRYSGPAAPLGADGRVDDTSEVKAAKLEFQAAYNSAAAKAAPATIGSLKSSLAYSVPAAKTTYLTPVHYAPPIRTSFSYSAPGVSLDASGNVQDTAEVVAAKASFKAQYDAAAAAAAIAPDTDIITGHSPMALTAFRAGYTYGAPAPATILVSAGPVLTLDAAGNVQDTAEVAAAKASFKAQYNAAAAAAEAAPDTGIITAGVKAAGYGSRYQAKASHHGDAMTYSFDGITVMQADGASSPAKFGYTYE